VFVVETLEHAVGLWEKNGIRATLVTLEGDTVSPEGVISGGAARQEAEGLLRKNRQIRELRQSVERRGSEAAGLQAALAELDRRLEELQGRHEAAREELHRRELQVAHLGKDVVQLRERRERLEERREALEFERDDLAAQLKRAEAERAGLAEEKDRRLRDQEEAEGRVAALQRRVEEGREAVKAADAALTQARVREAADEQRCRGLRERLRSLGTSRESLSRRAERLEAELAEAAEAAAQRGRELSQVTAELSALSDRLTAEESTLSAQLQALDAKRGGLTEEEREAGQARREADEAQRRLSEAALALREVELRLQSLQERYRERQLGDLEAEARAGLPEAFDEGRAEGRIRELDARLEGFGEINLLAIDEYEERKKRHAFLEAQRQDLEQSLESLRQAIQRINRVSRERFGETFERVNATFRELFPKIFRGGEAWLVLSDPENLLETGVDIVARPPGKKPQHISLLSGGEKALTAVALIFSIFLVKPSPFCILDEVDAPLDEANIGRFTEMVRSLSSSSQFLVITHNKSTMEGADQLYGVTMPEPGVSRAVSVRLREDEPEQARAA
jgi:chromosome segregation protein